MQVENDYDKDVYNAISGSYHASTWRKASSASILDGREVIYGFGELDEPGGPRRVRAARDTGAVGMRPGWRIEA